ncbi:MAG: lysine--tRNA ligase, partial [Patescibacteria group bacterium]
MFWSDKIAKQIIESGIHRPFWVDDMFTPSGFAHIGSLRGPLVHDMVYRALGHAHAPVTFTYIFNDFDPIDGLPPELASLSDQLGKPLRTARSPEKGYESFAEYFTKDFQQVLKSMGVMARYLSSWDMYREGKFNGVIREALDNSDTIQGIYQRVSGSKKREKGWMPLQVVCEKCGKLGTTRVHAWDGSLVAYTCEPTMVTWAKGCGYTGKISPFDGNGKLPWKVDWPAHWKVLGVTIEGAGKDHSSAGGSRDIAKALCEEVFHIANPYNLPYEFILIGGKKMSSSKGLGLKARDLTKLLPPSVGRFLFTRTDYHRAIEFDPVGTMAIPDLFDEYDRCWQAYNEEGDEELSHAFEYA